MFIFLLVCLAFGEAFSSIQTTKKSQAMETHKNGPKSKQHIRHVAAMLL